MINKPLHQLVLICLYLFVTTPVMAITLVPTDNGELLDKPLDGAPDDYFPGATTTARSNTHESRAFFEYDLSTAPAVVDHAELTLGPVNTTFSQCGDLIPCPLIPSVVIFSYPADGTVAFSDYSLGTHVVTISPAPQDETFLKLDVTPVVQASVTNGDPFIGFATRAWQQGAISFGGSLGTHTLAIFPEPSSFLLAVIAVGVQLRGRGGGKASFCWVLSRSAQHQ